MDADKMETLRFRLSRAEHQIEDSVKSFNLREFSSTTHLKAFNSEVNHAMLVKNMNEYNINEINTTTVGRKVIYFFMIVPFSIYLYIYIYIFIP